MKGNVCGKQFLSQYGETTNNILLNADFDDFFLVCKKTEFSISYVILTRDN